MAVGAGSIKRASKLNAEAESKKQGEVSPEVQVAVEKIAESAVTPETAEKAPAKKTTTSKAATTKSAVSKTAAKSTSAKTTAKKVPAKKAAEKPVEEKATVEPQVEDKPVVEASVVTNIDPVVLDVVLGKKAKANKACHLTEDMPIHLL